MDYWTAKAMGSPDAIDAWNNAPHLFGAARLICDLPAFFVTIIITWIIYVGIKESKRTMNAMVILKLAIILLVIVAGAFYVAPDNWHPFLPNGMGGVMAGTAAVFFSYIGFDAISTTAEECKDPQRDLPKGMFYSLIICTVVYVLIALVLTGMVSYKELAVGDPLSYVFRALPGKWPQRFAGVIEVSAVIATASVLLVFQLGQPRIWMSMSRDGLLPPIFARIHPKYKTPSFSTILTGVVVGVPALFMNLNEVVNLTSVGTLFAFVLVCGGILKLQADNNRPPSKYKTPYINSKWVIGLLFIGTVIALQYGTKGGISQFFSPYKEVDGKEVWVLREKVPYYFFAVVFVVTSVLAFLKNLSLIPVMGFLCCSYLLCESGTSNWERFLIWLVVGLALYFVYGRTHSKLAKQAAPTGKAKGNYYKRGSMIVIYQLPLPMHY
jgi:amino acid transporter